jgi:hypothetical protein
VFNCLTVANGKKKTTGAVVPTPPFESCGSGTSVPCVEKEADTRADLCTFHTNVNEITSWQRWFQWNACTELDHLTVGTRSHAALNNIFYCYVSRIFELVHENEVKQENNVVYVQIYFGERIMEVCTSMFCL